VSVAGEDDIDPPDLRANPARDLEFAPKFASGPLFVADQS
jgi:hypothetical protein